MVLCPGLWKTWEVKRSKVPNPGVLQGMDAAPEGPGARAPPPPPLGVAPHFPQGGCAGEAEKAGNRVCVALWAFSFPSNLVGLLRISPQRAHFTPGPSLSLRLASQVAVSCVGMWPPKLCFPCSVPFILTTSLLSEELHYPVSTRGNRSPERLAHAHSWEAARQGLRPGPREPGMSAPCPGLSPCTPAT